MSKSTVFGAREAGVVTLVDPPVSRKFVRRARLVFFGSTAGGTVLGAIVGSAWSYPFLGALVGALVGALLGAAVSLVLVLWPILRVLWHWAVEIATTVGLVAAGTALATWTHPLVLAAVAVVVGAVVGLVRPIRTRLVAWVWCAIVRHRLRLCFDSFLRIPGRNAESGSRPLILLARPTPAGERVWVWLRPGLDLSELDGRTDKVAVACWASEVRVVRASAHFAGLIRVDITRRDPLTATVVSPLRHAVPDTHDRTSTAWADIDTRAGLDLRDVPSAPTPRGGAR